MQKIEKINMEQMLLLFQDLAKHILQEDKETPNSPHLSVTDLWDTIDLTFTENGVESSKLKEDLLQLMKYTPKTASKTFFNQLFGGRMPEAILGDLIAVMLNNSMYTYKAAGAQVGAEKAITNKVLDLINWGDGGGTLAPGGSMANFMGMLMARDAKDASIKMEGSSTNLRVYTSEVSHYSTPKNAAFAGIGRNNVVKVRANERGEMDMDHLEDCILNDMANGKTPFLINCTAGTTVLGAFDNIDLASSIAKKYELWLHVDGAYCGAVILSEKYKHLMNGIEKADSFCFNAHKMLGTSLSCSLIFAKNKEYLYDSFSNPAEYLYQTDEDDYNLGKISLQCGRRNDALKLWTLWKSIGNQGMEKLVNAQFDWANYALEYVKNNSDYEVYSFDNSVSVCFNYKGIPANQLCTELYEQSVLMVGYGQFDGKEFVRMVTVNTNLSKQAIKDFFEQLEKVAENVFV